MSCGLHHTVCLTSVGLALSFGGNEAGEEYLFYWTIFLINFILSYFISESIIWISMKDHFLLLYVRMCRSMRTQWKEACASSSQGGPVHEPSKSRKNIRIFKANIMRWFVYGFFDNCRRSTYVRRRIIYGDAWMDGQEQRANSESWHFSRWA